MQYRPFKLLTSSTIELLRGKAISAVGKWGHDWLEDAEIKSEWHLYPMSDLTEEQKNNVQEWSDVISAAEYGAGNECWAYLQLTSVDLAAFGAWIASRVDDGPVDYQKTEIVVQLLQRAVKDLYRRVVEALSLDGIVDTTFSSSISLPDMTQEFRVGSGSVYAETKLAGVKFSWILGGGLDLLPEKNNKNKYADEVVNRELAIENQSVMVTAWLGETELTVDDLGHMAVGDVLRLDKKLDDPLRVTIGNNTAATLQGWLCTNEHHKALKLVE